jgi:uncharacterized protein
MAVKPFMTTTWSNLAMLNYEVDPGILRTFVPRGTELDDHLGRYFVSMVGFLYSDTRIFGLAVPGYRRFSEVNLRFYIRHRSSDGWRRGVAFIKEIVPLRAVAWTARKFYDENFVTHPMRYSIEFDNVLRQTRVSYSWRHVDEWQHLQLTAIGTSFIPPLESEKEFITEHYWGYTARRDGGTSEYRVEHPQWRVASAIEATLECDVAKLYDPMFVDSLSQAPSSAFLAEGSAVSVFAGRKLDQTRHPRETLMKVGA